MNTLQMRFYDAKIGHGFDPLKLAAADTAEVEEYYLCEDCGEDEHDCTCVWEMCHSCGKEYKVLNDDEQGNCICSSCIGSDGPDPDTLTNEEARQINSRFTH